MHERDQQPGGTVHASTDRALPVTAASPCIGNIDAGTPRALDRRTEHDHGAQCGCLILAAAVGGGREAVSFSYCVTVLQKHWQLQCNHGEHCATRTTGFPASRWHEAGSLDGVKAILVRES